MHVRTFTIFLFVALAIAMTTHCVSTADGVADRTPQSSYWDPDSPDTNASYFAKVKDYFAEIRFACSETELRQFTATRYIASQPPYAAVYVENHYMGQTNDRDLYFKPGQYVVTFYKGGIRWTEILSFSPGKNATLVTRKE
jgi:hypothetical protein